MEPELNLKTRREFLRHTLWGGALSWTIPAFVSQTFKTLAAEPGAKGNQDSRILVLLQMAGGNDGLNTVVPFTNDHYFRARPRLAFQPDAVLKVTDELGFHPALKGFRQLHDDGFLKVVLGAGYPNPNRSHFRSTEIWQTASDANKSEKYGWLGRYFDSNCSGAAPTVGVNVGRQTPQAFASRKPTGITLDNPENYRLVTDAGGEMTPEASEANGAGEAGGSIGALSGQAQSAGSVLDFLERTELDAQMSSQTIRDITRRVTNQATYTPSQLGNSLKLVARLIGGKLPTRVFYVSQGGYDTHTNQAPAHSRLLADLGDNVKSFFADLKAQGNVDRVLLMTFSEFGRRVTENASGGTDHGAAAPLFLVGNQLKPGFTGPYPSLAPGALVNGDLKFAIDFRSVYAGVLEHWLRAPSEPVLGRKFEPLALA